MIQFCLRAASVFPSAFLIAVVPARVSAAAPAAPAAAAPAAPTAAAPAALATATPAAPAAPFSLEEIVDRASAQFERKPKKLACTVTIDAAQLDSDGKPKETQGSELVETWTDGVEEEGPATGAAATASPSPPRR